jgi:hypothetical protein
MFEGIASSLKKLLPKDQTTLYVLLFLVLVFAIYMYSGSKTNLFDSMETGAYPAGSVVDPASAKPSSSVPSPSVSPSAPNPSVPSGFALQPVANPADLLPKDQNSQWSALNPSAANKGDILMPDLLQAGYHIGLDTIGQTLRNPNYQLRSDPLIPKSDVGPWNHSTIEPDLGRVPLELGGNTR